MIARFLASDESPNGLDQPWCSNQSKCHVVGDLIIACGGICEPIILIVEYHPKFVYNINQANL